MKSSLAIFALTVFLAVPTHAQILMPYVDGKVISVTDGDSFALKSDGGKVFHVRLLGIAAPEVQQPFGREARKKLSDKIMGKDIRVFFKVTDNLACVLGRVIVEDEDLGLEQLRTGFAWYFTHYINELTDDERAAYDDVLVEAKKSRIGLWKDATPIAPWTFRTANKINEIDQVVPDKPVTASVVSIKGDSKTKVYMKSTCRGFKSFAGGASQVTFADDTAAKAAGYRIARGCQ